MNLLQSQFWTFNSQPEMWGRCRGNDTTQSLQTELSARPGSAAEAPSLRLLA